MVFVAVFTGLRVGELLGLKWSDIDLQKMVVHVVRSIVKQHVGDCKNGSLSQTGSARFAIGQGPVGLAAAKPVPD
jgi:integrase